MYLTKMQREMIMLAGVKGGAVREFVRATPDLTPQEKWRLKTADTNMKKAMESYCSRLAPEVQKRLWKDLNTSDLQVVPERGAAQESSKQIIDQDDLYVMAEMLMWAICQNTDPNSPFRCTCKEDGKPFRKCKLYNAMIHSGLARASYIKGQCPYKL